jgi:hypothetical protein
MRIFVSTDITELILASACHMVASLTFFNPKLTLAALFEIISFYES